MTLNHRTLQRIERAWILQLSLSNTENLIEPFYIHFETDKLQEDGFNIEYDN